MSLINQMLQDLDNRRAAHGVGTHLPNDVRPLPQHNPSRLPWVLGGMVVLVLAGGLAFYHFSGRIALPQSAPVQPVIAVSAPETVPSTPEPAAPAPPSPDLPVAPVAVGSEPVPAASPLQELDGSLRMADALTLPLESRVEAKKPGKSESKPKAELPAAASEQGAFAAEAKAPAERRVEPEQGYSRPSVGAVSSGNPAKAGAIVRSDVAVSPRERAEGNYRKAIAAVNQGRIDEATEALRHALREDAMHSASRQLLVKLLLEARRTDEAMAELEAGLHVQPAQLGWAMSLARLQVSRGDLNGAWKTLEFSMPAASNNVDYLGFSGHILHRLGRDKESADYYQKAIRLAPGDGRWWLGLGLALDAEGRSAEAREALLQAKKCGNLSPELSALADQRMR